MILTVLAWAVLVYTAVAIILVATVRNAHWTMGPFGLLVVVLALLRVVGIL